MLTDKIRKLLRVIVVSVFTIEGGSNKYEKENFYVRLELEMLVGTLNIYRWMEK